MKVLLDRNATVYDLKIAGKDLLKELNRALERERKLLVDYNALLSKYYALRSQMEVHDGKIHTDNN